MDRRRGDTRIGLDLSGHGNTFLNGSVISTQDYSLLRKNVRFMEDETHPLWTIPRLRKKWGSVLNLGGPMDLIEVEWDFPVSGSGAGNSPANSIHRRYDGDVIAMPGTNPADLDNPAKAKLLACADPLDVRWGLGGQAISACRPAQPEASFGQFLVELYREGIPSLFQRLDVRNQVEFFRGLGGNYLNVEFGWKPFVADIRKTLSSLQRADEILTDLYAHNGEFIRRRYTFPVIQTTAIQVDSVLPWPTLTTAHWSQTSRTIRTVDTKETWFSGEFMYHLPPRGTFESELRVKARHLLGVDITPELLWNVAPWTWLFDWFGSIGDSIGNAQAISSDNLVLRYGYLMQKATREVTTTHQGVKTLGYGRVNPTITGTLRVTNKTRCLASPYGFGLRPGDLSFRQWAILTALGLVKNPGGIRYQNG